MRCLRARKTIQPSVPPSPPTLVSNLPPWSLTTGQTTPTDPQLVSPRQPGNTTPAPNPQREFTRNTLAVERQSPVSRSAQRVYPAPPASRKRITLYREGCNCIVVPIWLTCSCH